MYTKCPAAKKKVISGKINEAEKQKRIQNALKREAEQYRKEFADSLLKLMTSGFGLVAALAWNELIKEVIKI